MADTNVKMYITAVDKASTQFKKVGDTADTTHDKIKRGAVIAGAAIAALAVKIGVESVHAYAEAESAQAKLTDAFKKFKFPADISLKSLQDFNTELGKKTKFDDDAVASGQAVLANFVDSGKQLKALTPLLLDYAAKTGQDLPAAASAMGKAFLGNTRALKSLGINYKMTGDATQDMANITQLMREKVGGFAEKEGKTAAGQAAILQNQFGEVEETIGSKLVPVLTILATKLLSVIEFIQRNGSVIGPAVIALTGFAAAVVVVNKAAAAARSIQAAFNTVVGLFASKAVEAEAGAGRMGKTIGAGGVWGIAIVAATAALGYFAIKHAQAAARVNELAASLNQSTGAITRETRATVVNTLEKSGALVAAQRLNINLGLLTDAALGNESAQKKVNRALALYTADLPEATGKTAAHTGANVGLSAAQRKVAADAAKVSGAISSTSGDMTAARDKTERLSSALGGLSGAAHKAGEDYAFGLAAGIRAGSAAAVDAAIDMAGKVTAAVARAHVTHSPSKVAFNLGKFFTEGITAGLKAGTQSAIDAAKTLADKITAKLKTLRDAKNSLLSSARSAVMGGLDLNLFGAKNQTQAPGPTDIARAQISVQRAQDAVNNPAEDASATDQQEAQLSLIEATNRLAELQAQAADAAKAAPSVTDVAAQFANDAGAFAGALSTAVSKGIPGSLIQQVAQLGPAGLQTATALASLDAGQVAQLQVSLGQAQGFANAVGQTVLTTTSLPGDIAREEKKLTTAQEMLAALRQVARQLGDGKTEIHIKSGADPDEVVDAIQRYVKRNGKLRHVTVND